MLDRLFKICLKCIHVKCFRSTALNVLSLKFYFSIHHKIFLNLDSFSLAFVSDENYSFVEFLLGIQKIQEWLNSIELRTQNLTSCLKIMELLLKWRSIDSIRLKYSKLRYSISYVDNEKKVIKESVQKLIKQVGFIKSIKITKR